MTNYRLSLYLLCFWGIPQKTHAFPILNSGTATALSGASKIAPSIIKRGLAFATAQYPNHPGKSPRPTNSNRMSSSMIMFRRDDSLLEKFVPLSSSLQSVAKKSMADGGSYVTAELLNDMAHIALDFTTIFGADKVNIRLATLVGRILSMLADYLPDHSIRPDELAFQFVLLGITANGLIQSALLPMTLSNRAIDYRDRKAYSILMRPAGVTWSQYKTLLSRGTLDWVREEAGKTILERRYHNYDDGDEDDDYVYWLYKGSVDVQFRNKGKQRIFPNLKRTNIGKGLIGENHLAQCFEKSVVPMREKGKRHLYDYSLAVLAGYDDDDDGATFLRIHKKSLMKQMEHDQDLAQSIRLLLIHSMKDKLNALIQA